MKLVALIGKAGSGKDSVLANLVLNKGRELNLKPIVSCTSRPPRDYEIEGKDYYFHTQEEMEKKIERGEMLEMTKFNDWYYGTSKDSLDEDKINIGVFNPEGVENLYNKLGDDLTVIWIQASDKTRLVRQLSREKEPNCEEICRRYQTDKFDFNYFEKNFEGNYIKVQNDVTESIIEVAYELANIIKNL